MILSPGRLRCFAARRTYTENSMPQYKLSLGRWHKVGQRLQGEIARLSNRIDAVSNRELSLTAQATTGPEVLDEMRADIEEMLQQHKSLVAAWVMIRDMLALKNAESGVSTKLSKIEGINLDAGVLRKIHNAESVKQHGYDDYKAMAPVQGAIDGLGRSRGGVTAVALRLRSKAEQDDLLAEIQRLSRMAERTGDEINTINAITLLELELSDDVAKVAALDEA
jgi:hypothetical protein